MSGKLKSLDELTVEVLPLKNEEGKLVITEGELETYLIKNYYNVYTVDKDLTREMVETNGLTQDSTLIFDAMSDLGFESIENEKCEYSFVLIPE